MRLLLAPVLLSISAQAFAGTWSNLWLTPEQQGQRLLDAGQPDEAAKQFRDPRRRAYADVKAGNYSAAADQLAALEDADSLYNRGNALARAGKLKEALAAYDAALARAPTDRDARHNRDLVARQLQKQSAGKPGGKGNNQPNGSGRNGAGQSGAGQQQNGDPQNGAQRSGQRSGGPQNANDQQSSGQQNRNQQNGSQQNARAEQSAANASQSGQNQQPSGNSQPQGPASQSAAAQNEHAGQAGSQAPAEARAASPEDQANEARRDAAAALQAGKRAPHDSTSRATAAAGRDEQPKSEQALALEQWLRRIPEDPGGLLRRKFLIEHMMRQQQQQQDAGQ